MFQFFRDLFVVIVLMSMLGGCKKAPSVAEEADVKTLTFWHIMNYSGPKEVLEGAVKRFEAAHPGVKVIVQTFENDAYKVESGLTREIVEGSSPVFSATSRRIIGRREASSPSTKNWCCNWMMARMVTVSV